jgi:uncharacterized protein YkwD
MKHEYYLTIGLVLILALSACRGDSTATTDVESGTETQASETNQLPSTNQPENPDDCVDQAAFIQDISVPDYTNFDPGKEFTKTWRIRNSGTCTWNSEYSLEFTLGESMDSPESLPLETIGPGEETDISVSLTAPNQEATYRADFQLVNPQGVAMPIDTGEYLWVIITVGIGTAGSDSSSGGDGGAGGASGGPGFAEATCGYTTDTAKTSAVLAAINDYRSQNGLSALTINSALTQAAQAHSADMACNQLFYHNGSNGSTPDSRVAAAGYSASGVTENVYGSYPPLSGSEVVAWWATDQTDVRHNENLLTTKYPEIGIGYAFYDNFGYYVAVFAAP